MLRVYDELEKYCSVLVLAALHGTGNTNRLNRQISTVDLFDCYFLLINEKRRV